jgi:hypothetical protein
MVTVMLSLAAPLVLTGALAYHHLPIVLLWSGPLQQETCGIA